jgi:hypothetical protein
LNFKVLPFSRLTSAAEIFHITVVSSSAARAAASVFGEMKTKLSAHCP